jgi:hypothetical protein
MKRGRSRNVAAEAADVVATVVVEGDAVVMAVAGVAAAVGGAEATSATAEPWVPELMRRQFDVVSR